jgi:glycosyltransferase involved in cell wall biosynthesis
MPTYRRAHLIGLTIQSILEQTFADFELLIRDDGRPDDGTEEAVKRAAGGDIRVHYHRNEKNLGMPGNLNDGIRASAGEFVAVCHDHDLFHPEFLEALVSLLDRHPSALYAHTGIEVVDQQGRALGTQHVGSWPPFLRGSDWLAIMLRSFYCPVCALTVVRRQVHERFGLYHPAYGFIADVEMWMRLAEVGDVAYAARPLVQVRTREAGHLMEEQSWAMLASVFAIHRRYLPRRYRGLKRLREEISLNARADATILRSVLSRWKRRKDAGFGPAKPLLGRTAGPIGRTLATILP